LIKIDSTKLFFDKYKYKVDLSNALGHVFRNKNMSFARKSIDSALDQATGNGFLRIGMRDVRVSQEELKDLQTLLHEFTNQEEDYKLRCETWHLGIYTNNFEWVKQLNSKLNAVCSIHMPRDNADLPKGVIINDTIKFAYKVTLNGSADPNLAGFCLKHKDKIKIGGVVLSDIKGGYNLKGKYMYVKDHATITLIRLFLKRDFMRIDKIVSSTELDK
jgi:hypothetical protein|tara:strand:+ start:7046 stop:7696 length:651 start_codon:yes stop_codon:yes gene_type:complete